MTPAPDPARHMLITGRAALDAEGLIAAPGAVLVRLHGLVEGSPRRVRCELLAVGPATEVGDHPLAGVAERIDRPDAVLVPALVNAHTHLDLSHLAPRPFDPARGFVGWIEDLRPSRLGEREAIQAAVSLGARMSLRGGVTVVGDIAGAVGGRASSLAIEGLLGTPLSGVWFMEFFAAGARQQAGLDGLQAAWPEAAAVANVCDALRPGLQPHAPYSVGLPGYAVAAGIAKAAGLRLATHLAESPEERRLIRDGGGPLRDFLVSIGVWDEVLERQFEARRREAAADLPARPLSPVRYLEPVLAAARTLAVHVNDCDDEDLAVLARTGTSVAYCPRASDYFRAGEHFGPHRYRDMLAAGITVALGTDSALCLGPEADPARAGDAARISVLDEMRHLWRRDRTDPYTLLAMATVNGARALSLHAQGATLRAPVGSAISGVLAIPAPDVSRDRPDLALAAALDADAPPELLAIGSL